MAGSAAAPAALKFSRSARSIAIVPSSRSTLRRPRLVLGDFTRMPNCRPRRSPHRNNGLSRTLSPDRIKVGVNVP
jgi:hypothetical protein